MAKQASTPPCAMEKYIPDCLPWRGGEGIVTGRGQTETKYSLAEALVGDADGGQEHEQCFALHQISTHYWSSQQR